MRVNVETRALAEGRLTKFMKFMRWKKREAIGLLVLFWHDTQEMKIAKGTREELTDFIDSKNEEEAAKIFEALLRAKYIAATDHEKIFEVRGNGKHILANIAMEEGATKGGRASAESKKNNKLIQPRVEPTVNPGSTPGSTPPPTPLQPNSIQFNSKQCNSVQEKEERELSRPSVSDVEDKGKLYKSVIDELKSDDKEIFAALGRVSRETQRNWIKKFKPEWIHEQVGFALDWIEKHPSKAPSSFPRFLSDWFSRENRKVTDPQQPKFEIEDAQSEANRKTWAAYEDEYRKVYPVDPPRNVRINSCVKGFVQRVGAELAPDVARFFVQHPDGFYKKGFHQFGLALRDAEALKQQFLTGRKITNHDIRNSEKIEATRSQLERIDRGEV